MIKKNTYLIPADKCGVFWVSVFHLYYGFSRKTAYCGNFVKISVKKTRPLNWLKKKTKLRGIIIRVRKENFKRDGSWVRFCENNVVLLKKRLTPQGKELSGPIIYSIKRRKFRSTFAGII